MKYPKLLIELKRSRIDKDGIGVFAVVEIKKGEIVANGIPVEDFSKTVPWEDFKHLSVEVQEKVKSFCVGTLNGFVPPENMDFNKLSIEWYFNHACNGNLGFGENGNLIAIKNIKKGEELTYDYGLVESYPYFIMRCECKARKCRKLITGNDWKSIIKEKNMKKYMHPFLVEAFCKT